jgi:hypothetical protein
VDNSALSLGSRFIRGQSQSYAALLYTKSKEVTLTSWTDGAPAANDVQAMGFAVIHFPEEELAQRVLKAFLHAADLCRSKEPF